MNTELLWPWRSSDKTPLADKTPLQDIGIVCLRRIHRCSDYGYDRFLRVFVRWLEKHCTQTPRSILIELLVKWQLQTACPNWYNIYNRMWRLCSLFCIIFLFWQNRTSSAATQVTTKECLYMEHCNINTRDIETTKKFLLTAFPHWRVRSSGRNVVHGRQWVHVGDDVTYISLEESVNHDFQRKPYEDPGTLSLLVSYPLTYV